MRSVVIVSTLVLRLKDAEYFLETKSGLRVVNTADFTRYGRRSGLRNPDKPKIFI